MRTSSLGCVEVVVRVARLDQVEQRDTRHGSRSASRSVLLMTTNSVAVMPNMSLPRHRCRITSQPLPAHARARACQLVSMLIISSRTSSCVLVLMQVLGALFECQGCVPPHIRKERSNLA